MQIPVISKVSYISSAKNGEPAVKRYYRTITLRLVIGHFAYFLYASCLLKGNTVIGRTRR